MAEEILNAIKNKDENKVKELVELSEVGDTVFEYNNCLRLFEVVIGVYNMSDSINSASEIQNNPTNFVLASMWGEVDLVSFLVNLGANIDARGSNGLTPLCGAVKNNHLEIVKKLLECGANINILDSDGNTPLQIAQQNQNNEIINILISH